MTQLLNDIPDAAADFVVREVATGRAVFHRTGPCIGTLLPDDTVLTIDFPSHTGATSGTLRHMALEGTVLHGPSAVSLPRAISATSLMHHVDDADGGILTWYTTGTGNHFVWVVRSDGSTSTYRIWGPLDSPPSYRTIYLFRRGLLTGLPITTTTDMSASGVLTTSTSEITATESTQFTGIRPTKVWHTWFREWQSPLMYRLESTAQFSDTVGGVPYKWTGKENPLSATAVCSVYRPVSWHIVGGPRSVRLMRFSRLTLPTPGTYMEQEGLTRYSDGLGHTGRAASPTDEDDSVLVLASNAPALTISSFTFPLLSAAGHGILPYTPVEVEGQTTSIRYATWVTADSFALTNSTTSGTPQGTSITAGTYDVYPFGGTAVTGTVTRSGSNLTFSAGVARLAVGNEVVLSSTGSLPAPLTPGTYYVATVAASTFNVSSAPGGPPIVLTSAGTGTHTLNRAAVAPLVAGVVVADQYACSVAGAPADVEVGDKLIVPVNGTYPAGEAYVEEVYSPWHFRVAATPGGVTSSTRPTSGYPAGSVAGWAVRCFDKDPVVSGDVETYSPHQLLWTYQETDQIPIRVWIQGEHVYVLLVPTSLASYRLVKLDKSTGGLLWDVSLSPHFGPITSAVRYALSASDGYVVVEEPGDPICPICVYRESDGSLVSWMQAGYTGGLQNGSLASTAGIPRCRMMPSGLVHPFGLTMSLSPDEGLMKQWAEYPNILPTNLTWALGNITAGHIGTTVRANSALHRGQRLAVQRERLLDVEIGTILPNRVFASKGYITSGGVSTTVGNTGTMVLDVDDSLFPAYLWFFIPYSMARLENGDGTQEWNKAPTGPYYSHLSKTEIAKVLLNLRALVPLSVDLEVTPGVAALSSRTSVTTPTITEFNSATWGESAPVLLPAGLRTLCVDFTAALEAAALVYEQQPTQLYLRLKCVQPTGSPVLFAGTSALNCVGVQWIQHPME